MQKTQSLGRQDRVVVCHVTSLFCVPSSCVLIVFVTLSSELHGDSLPESRMVGHASRIVGDTSVLRTHDVQSNDVVPQTIMTNRLFRRPSIKCEDPVAPHEQNVRSMLSLTQQLVTRVVTERGTNPPPVLN